MSDICASFILCCQLAELNGVQSIRDLPGCWEHQMDKDWHLSFNGHSHAVKNSAGESVMPFHVFAQHSSLLTLAIISPVGGMLVGAREEELIGALENAIRELGGVPATEEQEPRPNGQ